MSPEAQLHHEQQTSSKICTECGVDSQSSWTKLRSKARAFQPVLANTGTDAVVNAVFLALTSCSRAHNIKIHRDLNGSSSTLISAEVKSGARASSCSYEVVHLAKQALDAIAAQLDNVALLSARVQREDSGYSLRSSIACVPEGVEDRMCWDFFQKGCCPRKKQCRWHHPQDSDIKRIKISIRYSQYSDEAADISGEKQLALNSSAGRHKIFLGELV